MSYNIADRRVDIGSFPTKNKSLLYENFNISIIHFQGKERLLERRCGTKPYIAPEILVKSKYHAEPADIWSCGIVLVAMLSGGT